MDCAANVRFRAPMVPPAMPAATNIPFFPCPLLHPHSPSLPPALALHSPPQWKFASVAVNQVTYLQDSDVVADQFQVRVRNKE